MNHFLILRLTQIMFLFHSYNLLKKMYNWHFINENYKINKKSANLCIK